MTNKQETMTIGEFAERVGLSVSAVRFYGNNVLPPAGIDPDSGYRQYLPEQVPTGMLVRDLRRLDLSLGQVEHALKLPLGDRTELIDLHIQDLASSLDAARDLAATLARGDELPRQQRTRFVQMQSTDLARAIDQVVGVAGSDLAQPHLFCVLIESNSASLRLVATDSYRMSVRDLVPAAPGDDFTVVVSSSTLASWQPALRTQRPVELSLNDDRLRVTGTGMSLEARSLPVTFPDYRALLDAPASNRSTALVDRSSFLDIVETQPGDDPVVIAATTTELTVGSDANETVSLAAQITRGPRDVIVNRAFAAEAARNSIGTELIIEVDEPEKPLVFRSATDGSYVAMVMPIKAA